MASVYTQARRRALTRCLVRLRARPAMKVRTLGDILDSLPHSGMPLPRLSFKPLHSDGLTTARLPK